VEDFSSFWDQDTADFPSTQDTASALVTDLEHLDFDDTELG
jgi:hypothetical protein